MPVSETLFRSLRLANKSFPESEETQQGHMRGQRQGVRSTKSNKMINHKEFKQHQKKKRIVRNYKGKTQETRNQSKRKVTYSLAGFPTKRTWLKAICNGSYLTWPLIKLKNVNQFIRGNPTGTHARLTSRVLLNKQHRQASGGRILCSLMTKTK